MQLSSRIFSRKTPLDLGAGGVALVFQLLDFTLERGFVSDASVQALATKDAQLDFRHVQPTAMLRRVVKLQFAKYPPRFFWREPLVERGRLVHVQVVHHDPHPLGKRKGYVGKPLHLVGEVCHRPVLGDFDMSEAALRLTKHKQVAPAAALVFVIKPLGFCAVNTPMNSQWR